MSHTTDLAAGLNLAAARTDTERKALEAIDFDGLVSAICELVAIPSLGGEESAAQRHMASKMKEIGLDVDVWDINYDELRKHPAFSMEVDRKEGLGVVGTTGQDQGGRSLILNGHIDVVPAGSDDNWDYPAWEGTVVDDKIYGRGALDMKSGLCCGLYAAKAIIDSGIDLRGKLMVQSVIGEEDGGVGALATVVKGYQADGAVIMEPTELAIAPAQAGALGFRITIHGLSAHACMRGEGVSAVKKFFPIYQALQAFELERSGANKDPLFADYAIPYPLSIGTVRAGNWPSSVPEELVCEGRFGIAVGEDIDYAKARFEEVVKNAATSDLWLSKNPPIIEWWGGQFEGAGIDTAHPVVGALAGCAQDVMGREPKVQGMTYGADMRLLLNEGKIPTVMFGPGDIRRAHMPNEFVPISEVRTVVQTLVLTILRFCGHV